MDDVFIHPDQVISILDDLYPSGTLVRWARRKNQSNLDELCSGIKEITWKNTKKNGGGFTFHLEWQEGLTRHVGTHMEFLSYAFGCYCEHLDTLGIPPPKTCHVSRDLEFKDIKTGDWCRFGVLFPNDVRMLREPATSKWVSSHRKSKYNCPPSIPILFTPPRLALPPPKPFDYDAHRARWASLPITALATCSDADIQATLNSPISGFEEHKVDQADHVDLMTFNTILNDEYFATQL